MAEVELQYSAELIDGPIQIAIHTGHATHWHALDNAGCWYEIEKNDGQGNVTFDHRDGGIDDG